METAMLRGMDKANARFPEPEAGPAETDAAWERFGSYLEEHGLRARLDKGSESI
jgi:hypothetical protein